MKRSIFILLLLISGSLKAQTAQNTEANAADRGVFWDVYYGYRINNQDFYKQLNTTNSFKFGSPLQVVGIRVNEWFHINPRTNGFGHLGYSQILPQTIYIQDTLKGKITGGIFNVALGKKVKTKFINFHFYIGFNSGRLMMYKNELIRQKNVFFSPKVGVQPWFKFGKMVITANVEYEYDVSRVNWKKSRFANDNKTYISPLRQSAITVQAGVSFYLKVF